MVRRIFCGSLIFGRLANVRRAPKRFDRKREPRCACGRWWRAGRRRRRRPHVTSGPRRRSCPGLRKSAWKSWFRPETASKSPQNEWFGCQTERFASTDHHRCVPPGGPTSWSSWTATWEIGDDRSTPDARRGPPSAGPRAPPSGGVRASPGSLRPATRRREVVIAAGGWRKTGRVRPDVGAGSGDGQEVRLTTRLAAEGSALPVLLAAGGSPLVLGRGAAIRRHCRVNAIHRHGSANNV